MPNRMHRRAPRPIRVGQAEFGLLNIGGARFDLRDPYHLAVSMSWPVFVIAMVGLWLALNVTFALLYVLSPGDIVNAQPGSFADAFFFSIETLATVGYGVMAPATLYGHTVAAAEIVTGMAFTAIITGLLFVRFSRPKAKILYADDAVVTVRNGTPTLMVRLANGRASILTSANVRLFVLLAEQTTEGSGFRRIHDLHLMQSHLPALVVPWTLIHVIDEASPLFGHDSQSLTASDARVFVTIEARDQALAAQVHDMKDYPAARIRFGMRFANAVSLDDAGRTTADLSRIALLEPDP